MLRFPCTHCGKELKASPELAGRKVQCSRCRSVVVVPDPVAWRKAKRGVDGAVADEPPLSRLPPATAQEGEAIDMTAMVDIVFFLLIFFLVTSMHSLQASMEMPPQQARQGAGRQKSAAADDLGHDYITVRIDRDDTVWVEDAEAPSYQEILARLREIINKPGTSRQRPELLVLADGGAHHGTVVMALDAGNEAGVQRLQLAMDDEF